MHVDVITKKSVHEIEGRKWESDVIRPYIHFQACHTYLLIAFISRSLIQLDCESSYSCQNTCLAPLCSFNYARMYIVYKIICGCFLRAWKMFPSTYCLLCYTETLSYPLLSSKFYFCSNDRFYFLIFFLLLFRMMS